MTSSSLYTVTDLTQAIQNCLRDNFDRLRVEGEISDFTHYQASGHMYFSLADDKSTLGAVMFRRANQKLEFEPEEGMTVVAEGRLDVYEERGNYQLIVEELEHRGTGDLEKEFQELKQKLESEGALDQSLKKQLPRFPTTIGVVTSGDGAAFWDIAQTINRRCPLINLVLYPARVNGRESAPDICKGIHRLPQIVDVDCIIVGRGGGSPEDLWGFNTEEVARSILESPVPVVSAVGHEIDVTISDLVADHRSPTPTAAGEELVPSHSELQDRLADLKRRIKSHYRSWLDRQRDSLRFISEKSVFSDVEGLFKPFRDEFNRVYKELNNQYKFYLSNKKKEIRELKSKIQSLDPTSVLNRGFSLIYKDDKIVKNPELLDQNDTIKIKWDEGQVKATVDEILP